MKLPSILSGLVLTLVNVMPASAADPMRFALCYDLTKAYTFVTPQVAQAARDYADLLNLKGGIEGHPVEM
ncbi:MAG TPA: branched-chain amino acid ABC transporter substrate-binding protein, partial [Bradyrhizobium sp.]